MDKAKSGCNSGLPDTSGAPCLSSDTTGKNRKRGRSPTTGEEDRSLSPPPDAVVTEQKVLMKPPDAPKRSKRRDEHYSDAKPSPLPTLDFTDPVVQPNEATRQLRPRRRLRVRRHSSDTSQDIDISCNSHFRPVRLEDDFDRVFTRSSKK